MWREQTQPRHPAAAVYIQLLKAIGESQTPERVKLVRFFCIESRNQYFFYWLQMPFNIFVLQMKDKYNSILRYPSICPGVIVPCIVSVEDRLWAAWPGGGAWLRPTKFKLKGVCQSVSDNPSLPPSLINTRPPIGRHRGGGGSTNQRRGWLARRPAKINIWDCMSLTNRE